MWAFSPTDVWVIDGSSSIQRYDGEGWSVLDSGSNGGLLCIFALSPTEVWLCSGGDLLFYDGATFEPMNVSQPTGLSGLTDVWASSASDVWAVGDDAIVAHYDGNSWGRTIAGSPFKSSIWGSGPSDVYALSTFDLVHYDGSTWTEIDLDAGAGDGQVWGTSASDVWVMTDNSELSHFDGAQWQTIDTFDFVGDLSAVWGPSPDDLWAVGSAGAIAHYDGNVVAASRASADRRALPTPLPRRARNVFDRRLGGWATAWRGRLHRPHLPLSALSKAGRWLRLDRRARELRGFVCVAR